MTVTTGNVWARELVIAGNTVRQLLVPASTLEVVEDGQVLRVRNSYGVWPATRAASTDGDGVVTAQVSGLLTSHVRATWQGGRDLVESTLVLNSYVDAIGFRRPGEPGSLRRPQLGAMHSVLGYWTSGMTEPGVVVMPTGTGKTETMVALLVAERLSRLLVIVPTAALREQIAKKFETLGVLQRFGIVVPTALRPTVGRLEHGLTEPDEAERFTVACNVVVATPQALTACSGPALDVFYASFTHLMVDEARVIA